MNINSIKPITFQLQPPKPKVVRFSITEELKKQKVLRQKIIETLPTLQKNPLEWKTMCLTHFNDFNISNAVTALYIYAMNFANIPKEQRNSDQENQNRTIVNKLCIKISRNLYDLDWNELARILSALAKLNHLDRYLVRKTCKMLNEFISACSPDNLVIIIDSLSKIYGNLHPPQTLVDKEVVTLIESLVKKSKSYPKIQKAISSALIDLHIPPYYRSPMQRDINYIFTRVFTPRKMIQGYTCDTLEYLGRKIVIDCEDIFPFGKEIKNTHQYITRKESLQKEGWTIVFIPSKDWKEKKTTDEKVSYLFERIAEVDKWT